MKIFVLNLLLLLSASNMFSMASLDDCDSGDESGSFEDYDEDEVKIDSCVKALTVEIDTIASSDNIAHEFEKSKDSVLANFFEILGYNPGKITEICYKSDSRWAVIRHILSFQELDVILKVAFHGAILRLDDLIIDRLNNITWFPFVDSMDMQINSDDSEAVKKIKGKSAYIKDMLMFTSSSSNKFAMLLARKVSLDNGYALDLVLHALENASSKGLEVLLQRVDEYILHKEPFACDDVSQSTAYFKVASHRKSIFNHSSRFVRRVAPNLLRYFNINRVAYFRALENEKKFNADGYCCFYHGQVSSYGLQEDFTRELIASLWSKGILYNKLPDDFVLIRNNPGLISESIEDFRVNFLHDVSLQAESPKQSHHRLSVNIFLAGCLMDPWGSCTLEYIRGNYNVTGCYNVFRSPVNIFDNLLIPRCIFEKHKAELIALKDLHLKLFRLGRMLQVCIPERDVDRLVYLAGPSSYKRDFWDKTTSGLKLSGPRDFITKAFVSPEDFESETLDRGSEGLIVLTRAGLLDPGSGIKIFAYDSEPTDMTLYLEYLQKKRDLIESIASDAASCPELMGKKYYLYSSELLK